MYLNQITFWGLDHILRMFKQRMAILKSLLYYRNLQIIACVQSAIKNHYENL